MTNRLLKNLTIFIFTLALLLWAGVGYLHLSQSKTALTFQFPNLSLPNLSSKTFQSQEFSFSFNYPSVLNFTQNSPHEPTLWERVSFYDKNPGTSLLILQINQVTPQDHKLFNYASRATLDNPVIYEDKSNDGVKQQITLTPVSLNGINWVKADIQQEDQSFQVYLVTQKKSPAVYTISLSGDEKILAQIIRTFTFTKT